jgi:ABC-2 type transport system permease protein
MIRRILQHDWRVLRADATVWVVGGVFAIAIGYAMVNGVRWTTFQRDALRVASAEELDRYAKIHGQIGALERTGTPVAAFGDPRNPTQFGSRFGPRYAMLPPAPLAPLAIGQSDLLPYYFKVSTDARETLTTATEIENPQRLLVGRFDLAFVIIFLYPLLILAVTHNLLSGEKEQGTLALAASQPVSLGTLATGKVLLRALLLVGIVLGFSSVALLASGVSLTAPGAALRFTLWLAAVAAYGAFWFALALFAASFGRSSATNATALATAWLMLVVLLPSLFNLVATTLYPVPSRVEMIQAVRVASDEATSAGTTLLARYYEDHPELATGGAEQAMNDFNIIRIAVDEDVSRRARPVVDRYEQQLTRQQTLIDRLRFLSPAVLMQDALNDVAGTGAARHRHFLEQVDRFHAVWRGFIVPLIVQKARVTSLDQVPSFTFREESPASMAGRVVIAMVGLTLPALGIAWAGVRRLRHYPIVG